MTLAGTWRLVELGGAALQLDDGEREPELSFDADRGRVSGSGGCNRLAGSFETTGSELAFGQLATTRMACDETVMAREHAFLHALGSTTAFEVVECTLSLLAGDVVCARFEASEPETDEP